MMGHDLQERRSSLPKTLPSQQTRIPAASLQPEKPTPAIFTKKGDRPVGLMDQASTL